MATMTLTGRLVRANRALATLVRLRPRDLVGRFYGDFTDGRDDLVTGGSRRSGSSPSTWSSSSTVSPGSRASGGCGPRSRRCGTPPAGRSTCSCRSRTSRRSERPSRRSARARSGSGCWSRPWRTTRSSCWTRPATSSAGTAARSGASSTRRTRSSAALPGLLPARAAGAAAPRARARGRPARGALRGGGLARPQGRLPLLGQRPDHRGVQHGRRAHRVRQGHPRHHRATATGAGARAGRRGARGRQRRARVLNRRLQQAAEDQSQFVAVTAHELRTPIGVLGGSADTLSRHWDQLTDDERVELFEAMADEHRSAAQAARGPVDGGTAAGQRARDVGGTGARRRRRRRRRRHRAGDPSRAWRSSSTVRRTSP